MKLLFDTSCLVAASVPAHPAHMPAWRWLDRALSGDHQALVASHSIAELYAVLTRLPLRPPIPPRGARDLVTANLQGFRTVVLEADDYRIVLQQMEQLNLTGGAIYDALIARAALKSGTERLLTLNPRDFLRLGSEVAAIVMVPQP